MLPPITPEKPSSPPPNGKPQSASPTAAPTDCCARCAGSRFVKVAAPGFPYGKAIRCPDCADHIANSRLSDEERQHTISDIRDRPDDVRQEMLLLRFLGKEMLRDPFGFLSIYGRRGGAKSLLLTALVADFCRARRQAIYFNASEIVTMLSPGDEQVIDGFRKANTYEAAKQRLMEVPVLAIDEVDKIRWTPWQIQHIGEVFEWRHRHADTRVTLLAMNKAPWQWHNAGEVEHIASRLEDGRFRRQWPAEIMHKCPEWMRAQGGDVPGLFEVTLADIRPTLRRRPGA